MIIKLRLCRTVVDPKTKISKLECTTIDKVLPDLYIDHRRSLPRLGEQVMLPASKAKALSSDTGQDILALARLASQASDIRNPALQREFAAFAQNAIKHFDLPEGTTLSLEKEEERQRGR